MFSYTETTHQQLSLNRLYVQDLCIRLPPAPLGTSDNLNIILKQNNCLPCAHTHTHTVILPC